MHQHSLYRVIVLTCNSIMDDTNQLDNLLFQYQLSDLNYVELPCFQVFPAIINQKVQPLLPLSMYLHTAYKYPAVQLIPQNMQLQFT